MQVLESIFQEYTRLRLNGLAAPEAVSALHPHLAGLDSGSRDELAQHLRAWETNRTNTISHIDRERLLKAAAARQSEETIACPHCQRPNVPKELICYACGGLLNPEQARKKTETLPPKTGELQNDAYFGEDDWLILLPDNQELGMSFQPQNYSRDLAIGRSDGQDGAAIDIDLETINAANYGVSRLHAALNYNPKDEALSLMDLGSTNGTFINEQRLHPQERRVIRNGDSLRFGRLSLRVLYRSN